MTMSKEPNQNQSTVSVPPTLLASAMLRRTGLVQVFGHGRNGTAAAADLQRGELVVALLEEAMAIGAMFAPSSPSATTTAAAAAVTVMDDDHNSEHGKRQ
jgi:hypothetical protein